MRVPFEPAPPVTVYHRKPETVEAGEVDRRAAWIVAEMSEVLRQGEHRTTRSVVPDPASAGASDEPVLVCSRTS